MRRNGAKLNRCNTFAQDNKRFEGVWKRKSEINSKFWIFSPWIVLLLLLLLYYWIFWSFDGFLIKFLIIAYRKVFNAYFCFVLECLYVCARECAFTLLINNITFLFEDPLITIMNGFIFFHRFHRTIVCVRMCMYCVYVLESL